MFTLANQQRKIVSNPVLKLTMAALATSTCFRDRDSKKQILICAKTEQKQKTNHSQPIDYQPLTAQT